RIQILDAQMELTHNKIPVTAERMKNKLLGTDKKNRMLVPIFEDHNNKVASLLGQEYAYGTLERYTTSLKHTIDFMKWKYSISDIDSKDINHAVIKDYEVYLRRVRKCNNNTTVKYLTNLKKFIRLCIANGGLERDAFVNYNPKVREVER